MAEAFLCAMAGERFDVVSAGAEATALDPEAIEAMQEIGFDISGHVPKKVDPFLRERFTYLITLCDRQIERSCPIFPGAIWRQTWPIESPATATAFTSKERRLAVRQVRDDIRQRVQEFIQDHA